MDPWNPKQYSRFQREREQPFQDLLALIQPAPDMRVVDLGCGTGSLTRQLHAALHAGETTGIDRSDRMLDAARADARVPGLRFEQGAIESFAGHGEYDLIFSNAAFHWVDDHEALIHRLLAALKPGGQLAFQIPAMHETITHTLADTLASLEPFRPLFSGWTRPQPVLRPDQYARILFREGCAAPRVSVVIYPHVLGSRDEVFEWMKGSLLTEYEKRLTPDQFASFSAAYRERLIPQLPDERPFFFPFRRLLCWARKDPE